MTQPSPGDPKRINVAVNPETVEMLAHVIERDGVSLTEAVRRLIGIGAAVDQLATDEGAKILAETSSGTQEIVIFR